MRPPAPTRRQFLAALGGLVGVGAVGWTWQADAPGPAVTAGGARLPDSPPATTGSTQAATPTTAASAASPTTLGSATTAPPPTTTTTSPAATTTTVTPTTTSTAPPSTATSSVPAPTTPPATTTTPPPSSTTIAAGGTGTVQAICRSAWGARDAAGVYTNHAIVRMTVHHTEAFLDTNRNAPARARAHQRFHIDDRGWVDLAYHFLVDANGHVYEGRPVNAVGDTGTNYDPTGHLLVCAEGDFNRQGIPAAQVAAVADVLAWGAVYFGVEPSTIRGHRDWAPATSCPGEMFYPLISSGALEQAVRERVAIGAPGLTILCGPDAARLVADIGAGLI